MGTKRTPEQGPEDSQLVNKLIRLKPETAHAYEMLKVEQGPRSGPRLAAEAFELLFRKYGKKPIGFP